MEAVKCAALPRIPARCYLLAIPTQQFVKESWTSRRILGCWLSADWSQLGGSMMSQCTLEMNVFIKQIKPMTRMLMHRLAKKGKYITLAGGLLT
jgi:hypothetical protein